MPRVKKTDDGEVVDYGNRPQIENDTTFDPHTASHNWQPDSPAVDQRDVSKPLIAQENLAQKIVRQEEGVEETTPEKPVVSKEDYDRRTKLDVSHPDYINPSLDHHEVTE
jgi:hypothetical protein